MFLWFKVKRSFWEVFPKLSVFPWNFQTLLKRESVQIIILTIVKAAKNTKTNRCYHNISLVESWWWYCYKCNSINPLVVLGGTSADELIGGGTRTLLYKKMRRRMTMKTMMMKTKHMAPHWIKNWLLQMHMTPVAVWRHIKGGGGSSH